MDEDITYNMISMGSQGADVGARIALLKPLGCGAAAVGENLRLWLFLRCGYRSPNMAIGNLYK